MTSGTTDRAIVLTCAAGLLAATLAACAACAAGGAGGAGGTGEARLLRWDPPPGQSCQPVPTPERLPETGEVLDAAGFVAAAEPVLAEEGYLLLSVSFDSAGEARAPRVVETDLEAGTAERLAERVASHVRPRPAGSPFTVLVLLEPGSVRVGRGEACRPVLANQAEIERALSAGVEAYLRSRPEALLPTRPVVVDVMVDTTGAAAAGEARLHQISGIPELDRLALNVAALMRFHPARLNGAAVPVWSRIPLTMRVERSRTRPDGV